MKRKTKLKILLNGLLVLLLFTTEVSATSGITQPIIDGELADMLGGVIGAIQIVGTAIAVGASIYLGIRYMLVSTEEKADIKKKMIPFVVGVILFYGATGFLQLIAGIAGWFK